MEKEERQTVNAHSSPRGSRVAPSPISSPRVDMETKSTTTISKRLSEVVQHPLQHPSSSGQQQQQQQHPLTGRNISLPSAEFVRQPKKECIMINNVHKTYLLGVEGVAALRGVSLTVGKGEFVMLLGKSGSGKTSLLNLIGTIDRQTRGDLRVCGTWLRSSTTDTDLARLRLTRLGFVFQTFNLIPSMNALDNVALPMLLAGGMTRQQAYDRARKLLDDVGMGPRVTHVPSQLSGGEQQRVTIARALANKPTLLLLDEPTGDLDSENTDNVMSILTKLNVEMGVTMIMVTHDPHLRAYAHRAVHMMDGKIVRKETISDGARAQLLAQKKIGHLIGRGFGTGDTEGGAQAAPIDLEGGAASDEKTETVVRPMMLADCTMTEVRQPMHYARTLGNANKTPALMVRAVQQQKENKEREAAAAAKHE